MAEYILSILKSQIFVLLSWGFHRPVRLENGLRFQVQGFIHKGTVEVVYVEGLDLFEVRTLNADGSIKQKEEDVYLDCLVNVIDGMVERTPNYKERVEQEYQLRREQYEEGLPIIKMLYIFSGLRISA